MAASFEDFIKSVPEEHKEYVSNLHQRLTEQGCAFVLKEARSGYTVSYQWNKKTVMNWVFRKAGMLVRIYGDNVRQYEEVVATLPPDMIKHMTGSRDCKRLLDPTACSDTCVMGFVYTLDGVTYKKCRNDGMLFLLTTETRPHIQKLVEAEVTARRSA